MTRDEMALEIDDLAFMAMKDGNATDVNVLEAAAAELRKSCAGCKHWRPFPAGARACVFIGVMAYGDDPRLPADGSGFCHEWSAK